MTTCSHAITSLTVAKLTVANLLNHLSDTNCEATVI